MNLKKADSVVIRNFIVKVTHHCNLNCSYCYVTHTRPLSGQKELMRIATLKYLIENVAAYVGSQPSIERLVFYWHGGEPLLATEEFFLTAFELQRKLIPRHITVVNTVQTNGTLIDNRWIEIFKQIGYDVCISLDGPDFINDSRRLTASGRGSYELVIRGIERLRENQFPISILSVISPESLSCGRDIYRHFRELGCQWMDFMYPFCNHADSTVGEVTDIARWGSFLCDVFDEWVSEGNPDVYVRQLHDWCMSILGGKTAMCTSQCDCSYVVTIEPDGSVYICDDLMAYYDSYLGNIKSDSLIELSKHPNLTRLSDLEYLVGKQCLECDIYNYCRGGCTLFRVKSRNDFRERHYFCDAQKLVINHIRSRLQPNTARWTESS